MLATRRRPVLAVARRPRHRRRAAPRRPGHRRAPRVEHGVRLLADHRHPLRGPGQHDLLAAHRGRGAVRRAARVAGADAARGAHRGRAARGHRDRDGRAVLGQRLRRCGRGRARVRAAGAGCSSGTSCGGARCGCSSGCSSPPGWSWARSTCCARPTSAPTWASSSRRPAPTSAARTLVLRRKASREPLDARPLAPALLPRRARGARGLPLVGATAFAAHAVRRACRTARATALALGIVAVLGFALNDSGITIPSMMAAVTEATVVILLAGRLACRHPNDRADRSSQPSSAANRAAIRDRGRRVPRRPRDRALPADGERRDPLVARARAHATTAATGSRPRVGSSSSSPCS